jgi:hypothetical protein
VLCTTSTEKVDRVTIATVRAKQSRAGVLRSSTPLVGSRARVRQLLKPPTAVHSRSRFLDTTRPRSGGAMRQLFLSVSISPPSFSPTLDSARSCAQLRHLPSLMWRPNRSSLRGEDGRNRLLDGKFVRQTPGKPIFDTKWDGIGLRRAPKLKTWWPGTELNHRRQPFQIGVNQYLHRLNRS